MDLYKRKITIDPRTQILQFNNGESYRKNQKEDLIRLSLSGFTITGVTGPDRYILISFKQKIKDLGIYDDVNDSGESNTLYRNNDIIGGLLNRR